MEEGKIIIGIVAVGTGLLTPPFGLLVFTVKSAIWLALLAVVLCGSSRSSPIICRVF